MKFSFSPGSKPLDGYTIKRAIHRGGFGEVYYARTDAGKDVALKLLHRDQEIEKRGVQQCLNLKNSHLVSIHDLKTDDDGDLWIVMEYVPGPTLSEHLAKHPDGLTLDDVDRWLSGMANGLDYLHGRGLVHRDLKPANVFQETDGVVKIGDVGLTKFITESRRDQQTASVGTVYYMAPEIANGQYGHEVDLYALGIILYEMLTGDVPFTGETAAEILMKHLTTKPDLTPLPMKLRPVIAKATAKAPAERYRSASELLSEFRKATGRTSDNVKQSVPVKPLRTNPSRTGSASTLGTRSVHSGTGVPTPPPSWDATLVEFGKKFLIATLALMCLAGHMAVWFRITLVVMTAVLSLMFWPVFFAGRLGLKYRESKQAAEESGTPKQSSSVAGLKRVHWRMRPDRLNPDVHRSIPFAERVLSLSNSMLLTAVVVPPLAIAMTWIGANHMDIAALTHFIAVAVLGTWGVLIATRMTEGQDPASGHRRLALGLCGVAVAVAAFGLQSWLMVSADAIPSEQRSAAFSHLGVQPLYGANRSPNLLGYIVFFGALFSLRRWWWQTDTLRERRFRISSVLLTVVLGFCIASIFAFSLQHAILWSLLISTAAQMSSGWMALEDRLKLVEATV